MTTYEIAMLILGIVLGFLSLYFKYNTRLAENVADFINEAEGMYTDLTKAGGKRFEWVVNSLYDLIPAPMRAFFTKAKIGELVQSTFDVIEDFAKKQIDKVLNK